MSSPPPSARRHQSRPPEHKAHGARWIDRQPRIALGAALLIGVTLLAYLPALRGGFFWDDDIYVVHNAALRSAGGLWRIWFDWRSTDQYYPLVFTSLWAEYHLWGAAPLGYHVTNVLLHALNTALVWMLLGQLRVPGAFLAAALFGLHPVHAESVAWISERKDLLSATLYLLSVLAWLGFVESRRWRSYALALALFVGAMLSKSIACTLPLTLLLIESWERPATWRREVPRLVPFVIVAVGLGLITMWREHVGQKGDIVAPALSWLERALHAGRAIWFYAANLLWPANLMRLYPRWDIAAGVWWQYGFPGAVIVVLAGLWIFRKRLGTGPLVAVLFFCITLSPSLGLIYFDFLRLSPAADHLQYLASIGLLALGAAGLTQAARRFSAPSWLEPVVAAPILVVLAVLTWQQARLYENAESVWRDTLARNPEALTAHYDLGTILAQRGQLDEAIEHFREAVRINPDYSAARNNWGTALDVQGKSDAALEQFTAVLRINPGDPVAHFNVATILAKQGKLDAAIDHLNTALRRQPDYAAAHYNLGALLEAQGRTDEAIQHFRETLRLDPSFTKAHVHLQRALAKKGTAP